MDAARLPSARVRRRKPNPLAWGALLLAVVLLVVLVRAVSGGDEYSPAALALSERTTRLGREVTSLRSQLRSIDRQSLFRRLVTWKRESQAQLDESRRLAPDEDRRVLNAYLVTSLGLRAEGMRRFDLSVRNALSDRDPQVAASQLLSVMRDLELSDRSYGLFASAWPRGAEGKPSGSRWVDDAQDATIEGVTAFVRELRKQQALAANVNMTVSSITVDPKPAGKERDSDQLPFTRTLAVSVVVTNTGNQAIPTVAVAAILTSETDPRPQTVEGEVGAMKPGEKRSVTLKALEPTAGGPINLLRVTVGPAGGERNTLDNSVEYKFVMRKP